MRKKKISMKDIADSLGVSVNTVSLALNNKNGISDETRQAIISKAKEIGYTVAVPSRPVRNIALLLDKRYLKNLSFYSRVVYGITDLASQNNCNVIVDFFDNHTSILPSAIVSNSVDGILTAGTISDNFLQLLDSTHLPLVVIDHTSCRISTDSVGTQNLQGGYCATQYLIDKGHRRIGFIGDIQYSDSLRDRFLGFCACMNDNRHLGTSPDYPKYSITGSIAPFVIQKNCAALAGEIAALPAFPTAWVCCNDETAVSIYQALSSLNLRPGKDVSIIGFDDVENCTVVQPNLTTMHVPKKRMGETAFSRLASRIENPSLPLQYITLPVTLVERDSVFTIQ